MTTQEATPATPGTGSRRAPVWLPAVAAVTLVLALVAGGGAPQPTLPGIPDPGPVTGWGLPLLRLAADLAAVCAGGLALTAALLLGAATAALLLAASSAQLLGERARDAGGVLWPALAMVLLAAVQIPLTLSNVLAEP